MAATGKMDFVPVKQEITAKYAPGFSHEVTLHDGSVIHLYKDDKVNTESRNDAIRAIQEFKAQSQVLTGLLYLDPDSADFHEILGTSKKPLRDLNADDLCPGSRALTAINASMR